MTTSFDAPQADRLDFVRRTVEAVAAGARGSTKVAVYARLAPRYAGYALHAARLLGLLGGGDDSLPTETATRLLATPRGSDAERAVLRAAFQTSKPLATVSAAVLGAEEPSRVQLAEHLLQGETIALATALRRAGTLLAWRRYLMAPNDGPQLHFAELEWADETDAVPPSVEPSETRHELLHETSADNGLATSTSPAEEQAPAEQVVEREPEPLPDSIVPPPIHLPSPPTVADVGDPERVALPPPAASGDRAEEQELLNASHLAYLRRQVEQGIAVLFTGAGFSLNASDMNGRPLPLATDFTHELWELCYPGETYDNSSLQDVFEHAQRFRRRALDELLHMRFTVDSLSLPGSYETWYSFPWSRIYTVNVDDMEDAAQRRFTLPRSLRAISGIRDIHADSGPALDVIHLNGMASHGVDGVTFSVDQFARRLARQEPFYAQLSAEVLTRPFIFVGSHLEEPLFWQHLHMRGMRSASSENELRPRSFMISPSLSRARADKLSAYNIIWVKATAKEFAEQVLGGLSDSAQRGLTRLRVLGAAARGDEGNILEVASVVDTGGRRTDFLLGEEPSWVDIRTGRAIVRDEDSERLRGLVEQAMTPLSPTERAPLVAAIATAGAGKTTFLMKAAIRIHSEGLRVAWVGADSEVHPRALTRYYRGESPPPVLVLDDAGRYGSQLVPMLTDLAKSDGLRLLIMGMRSHHEYRLDGRDAEALGVQRQYLGPLTDGDIDRLLVALEGEKRLGELRGMPLRERRSAFRVRADRQILVAMIEATSGERFEEKIIREWQDLEKDAQYVYALIALATSQGYSILMQEVLIASGGHIREMEAVRRLHRSHLITEDDRHRYRVRHRVIAEKLMDELAARGTQLEELVSGLCRALSTPPRDSRRRRVLKHLLSHDWLLRLLRDVEMARSVYAKLESFLDDDHHFWLQRGCLELEEGDVRFAQNFLEQAAALNDSDPLVETAYAHMQLRKAVANPSAPEAEGLAEGALETLRRLITQRGRTDHYPAHVFGSQALAWCRRAALVPRVRTALVREAKETVERAVALHRSRRELKQLLADLKKEEMTPR